MLHTSNNKYIIQNPVFTISSLFIAIGFLAIGYGMLMTYIGIYLKENGSTDFVIGIINSAFFAGAILSSIFSQKIISTVGHIRSFSAYATIMVITFLFHPLFLNELFWGILRLISGFAYYGLLIILESWLNEKSQDEYRGQTLAIYSIVFYLSTAVGQMILNIDDSMKNSIFSIGSVLVLISLVLIAITKIKEPRIIPFERYSLPKLASIAPLALLGSFISGFMVGVFFTMIPLYIIDRLQSIENLVTFMTVSLIGGLLAQFPIGKLSDRYGRRLLIAYTSAFITFISILFLLNLDSSIYTFLLGGLLGMGIFCIYPLSVARANDISDENKNVVEISRTLLFIYAAGSFSAPLLIGFGYGTIGYNTIFILFALLGIVLCAYSFTRERVPDEELTVFVKVPPVAADVISEMDPRQDEEWVNEKSKHINN
jgi:MFS family permease